MPHPASLHAVHSRAAWWPRTCLGVVAVLVAGSGLLCGCASFGAKDRVSRAVEVNSEAEFARVVLQARSPVIAIFHAPSCGTCHKVLKGLPDLADDYAGKVTFVTVDVAVCPKLGGDYGVRWVPVWVFLKDGQEQQRMSGWRPRFWTDGKIDDFLAGR